MKKTVKGPGGIKIVFNTDDPDTPVLVYSPNGKATATYACATETGELDSADASYDLNPAQLKWLEGFADEEAEAYNIARAGMPEYE